MSVTFAVVFASRLCLHYGSINRENKGAGLI